MRIPSQAPLHLLHQVQSGALATHSRDPAGFPYPTALPFAPTARHVPMILISHLAEHTRNLQADSRAGFLVTHSPGDDILEGQRLTLLGAFSPAEPDSIEALSRRYLRYHPNAARYLELGDFTFWVMSLERMRYIGGFGAMGWIDAAAFDPVEPLSEGDEATLFGVFSEYSDVLPNTTLIGIDRYGCDLRTPTSRNRFTFDKPKETFAAMEWALIDCIERHR